MLDMDRSKGKWFVINTLSGQENRVREFIEKQMATEGEDFSVYEVLVPMEKVTQMKQGRKIVQQRKFYPGYIMVRMDLYDPQTKAIREKVWYGIRNTQGVIGFIGGGDRPYPLSEAEVRDLLQQVEAPQEKAKPVVLFTVGEKVRIKEGAFENFEGSIEEIDAERGKLTLMVSIFGRSTPVELEFGQVERE